MEEKEKRLQITIMKIVKKFISIPILE